MENVLVANTFSLVAHVSIPLLLAITIGAICGGLLRVFTQIDDPAIGFIARFAGLTAVVLWGSSFWAKQVFDFALRIWTGPDMYH